MKKSLVFLMFLILEFSYSQNNKNYDQFLDQALYHAEKYDKGNFEYNLKLYEVAIKENNISPNSLSNLSRKKYFDVLKTCLYNGLFDKNSDYINLAVQFSKYFVENNNSDAMYFMSFLYKKGIGVAFDHAKEKDLLEQSANLGNSDSYLSIGYQYSNPTNQYFKYDCVLAKYWIQKAFDNGNIYASWGLGQLYLDGCGVEQNTHATMYYRELHLENMSAEVIYQHAIAYEYGTMDMINGNEQNIEKAKYWYKIACEKGHDIACETFKKL